MHKGWLFLFLAIIFGVSGTTAMKYADGFNQLYPVLFALVFYILSLSSATFAIKRMSVSIVYAIWSGIGTVLLVGIGALLFNEAITLGKILATSSIILGVVGLHYSESQEHKQHQQQALEAISPES